MSLADVKILIGIGIYLAVMVFVGLKYVRRGNTSAQEYFLAKRGFGPLVASMSAETSDMSGWLLMGLPGVAYFTGIGEAFWTALGLFIGTWVNWAVVAKRLRAYSVIADNAITLPEFFSKRYHDKNCLLLSVAAIISLVFFSIYTGAQIITLGKLFRYVFNTDMAVLSVLVVLIVLLYTLLGGFRSVGMTNLIQGLLMVSALLTVLIFAYIYSGGIKVISENLKNFPHFTDFFGIAVPETIGGVQKSANGIPAFGHGSNYSFLTIISTMAWGLGYFGMPQVLLRFMAIKNTSMIRLSRNIAVIWCFIVQFAAVAIGLIGRALLPTSLNTVNASESIFTLLSMIFFPHLMIGVIVSAILAASMSSMASYMLIVSSSLANDIYKGLLKKDANENHVILVSRATIIFAAVFGVIIAFSGSQSIFRVVSYAWAGLGAAFGPLVLFSLFWKRTTLPAAIAGMVSGGIMVVFWKNVIAGIGGVFAVYELLPAFVFSCVVIVIVSLASEKPSPEIEKEFEAAKTAEF
jgi:sodium/proline symporter